MTRYGRSSRTSRRGWTGFADVPRTRSLREAAFVLARRPGAGPLTLAALLLLSAAPGRAEVLNVPSAYPTIAAAVAAADSGDVVVIARGRYREADLIVRPAVSIRGATGIASDVVIDAEGRGRVLICRNVRGNTEIEGITLANGLADGPTDVDRGGGGAFFSRSGPVIRNCDFTGNRAAGSGGAVRVTYASPHFIKCRFMDNEAADGGGAIDSSMDSRPEFEKCEFTGNDAAWGGAVSARGVSRPVFKHCTLERNTALQDPGYGGAVYCDFESVPSLVFCILTDNRAQYGGAVAAFQNTPLLLANCSVVGNGASRLGQGMYCLDASPIIQRCIIFFHLGAPVVCEGASQPTVLETNIFGNGTQNWTGALAGMWSRDGNLSTDPRFCEIEGPRDLHLQEDSLCAPENSPSGMLYGALGVGCSTTEVGLTSFEVVRTGTGVDVRWVPSGREIGEEYRVEGRRITGDDVASWTVPHVEDGTGSYVAHDDGVEVRQGGQIEYRLWFRQAAGEWTELASETLTVDGQRMIAVMESAWPNPFNPSTQVVFRLERSAHVTVSVHDLAGRLVAELAGQVFTAGKHSLSWHGRDQEGREVPSGTYFLVLNSEEQRLTQKLTLLK
ncbi:MAG: FlgD immunoglobulin-like domain containing protein [Candidatus Krumholzibacteriia bacterium]